MQSFSGALCRALRGLYREPLVELYVEALVKLSVELLGKFRIELLAKLRAELLAKLRAELLAKLLVEPLVELCTELCTSLCQVYPLYSHLVPFLTLHTNQRTPIENDSNQSELRSDRPLPRIESDTDTRRQAGR